MVFRDLLAREICAPPWRRLLGALRRLEARGEIRGGRFVSGFAGEQYALPAAVEALRAARRPGRGEAVLVPARDPLNLAGIVTPGERVSPDTGQGIRYEDGTPTEVGPLRALRERLQSGVRPRTTATHRGDPPAPARAVPGGFRAARRDRALGPR